MATPDEIMRAARDAAWKKEQDAKMQAGAYRDKRNLPQEQARAQKINKHAEWLQKHSSTGSNTMTIMANPLDFKTAGTNESWVASGAGWALVNNKTGTLVTPAQSYVKKTDATESGHIVIPIIGNGVSIQGVRKTKVREGDVVKEVAFPSEMDESPYSGSIPFIKQAIFGESAEDKNIGMNRGFLSDTVKTHRGQLIEMDNGQTGVIGDDYRVRALTAQERQAQAKAIDSYSRDFRGATSEQAKWNNLTGLVTSLTAPAGAAFTDKVVMKQIYTRQLTKQIAKQPVVYRYLTEEGYQSALRYDSISRYATTKYSNNPTEIMQGAQIAEHWPGSATPSGKVKYRVEIPVDKLRGFRVPRPKGDKGWYWWETKAWSYPEYGKGGFQQFYIDDANGVPLKDVIIKEMK